MDKGAEKKLMTKLVNYTRVIFLPLTLAVLFVLQNQAFNKWLDIYSKVYSVRLFLVTFALGIVFYGPAVLFKKKYAYIYLFSISFLVSLIFIAQFLYYRYSQSFLQFSAIKYLGQAGSVFGTIKTLLNPELLFFISNLLLVLVVFILTFKKNHT